MKKGLLSKLMAVLLMGCIISTSIMPATRAMAAEEENESEGVDDTDYESEYSLGAEEGDIYRDLAVSTSNVSFGQVIEDSEHIGFTNIVKITNTGNTGESIIWSEYDPDDFFVIDAPDNNLIDAGETCNFIFGLDGYLSQGTYSGKVVFAVQEDQTKTATVNVSVTVVPGEPIVYDVDITPNYAEVSKGGSVQFKASQRGYNIADRGFKWKVDNGKSAGTKIGSDGYLTVGSDESSDSLVVTVTSMDDGVTSATARVAVKANYYNISAHAEEGGQVSGGGSVAGGGSIELFASPNNGYDFDGWYENGSKVSSDKKFRIDKVNTDRSFTARFKRRLAYVVTNCSPDNSGTTSGNGYYNVGDKVTVKATPKDGYRFVGWKMNNQIVSKEKEYTLTNLNGEYRLTACFEATEFTIKVCVTPDGAGQIDGIAKYKENSKAVLKAYAANGYVFKGWFSDSKLLSDKDTLTIDKVTKDYCLVAAFEKKSAKAFNMTSKAGAGGVIVPAGTYPVVENATVTYLITPSSGYKIADVKVDGKSVGAVSSYIFPNIGANHEISVTFAKKDTQKTQKTDDHSKNDVQNVVVKPTGDNVSESKKKDTAKTDSDKEKQLSEIEEANNDVEYDNLTGILQKYNMTPDEAYTHLYDEIGEAMFAEAYRDGTISFVCNNEYAPNTQATATNEFFTDPSVPNYIDVIDDCITDEEAIGVLKGNKLELHVDITDMTQMLSTTEKKAIFSYAEENGLTVGNVFDITVLRTYHDVMSNIKELDVEAEFVMQVPAELQSEAQEFKILHIHEDGSKEILEDLDNDPTTVTFKTKSFSNFAFAYAGNGAEITNNTVEDTNAASNDAEVNSTKTANKVMIIIVAVLTAVLLTLILLLILNKKSSGKRRK